MIQAEKDSPFKKLPCTNHKGDKELFKDLDKLFQLKEQIRNGEYLKVKWKGMMSIESYVGTKLIAEVLLVLEIDKNFVKCWLTSRERI